MTGGLDRVSARKTGTVLVADPDAELLHILELHLLHANFNVITTATGAGALKLAAGSRPDVIVLDTSLEDVDAAVVSRKLKQSTDTSQIPVIAIGARGRKRGHAAGTADGASHYIAKPFDPQEVVAAALSFLRQKGRAENVNALTGLANQAQLDLELGAAIQQGKTFAAMYILVDDLPAFRRVYGADQCDGVLRLLGSIIDEAISLFGNPDDLAAYTGSGRFVVLTTPYKARALHRRITADFNRRVRSLYAGEYLESGYAACGKGNGGAAPGPLMGLRIAVVTNQKRAYLSSGEVGEAAAGQLEYLKGLPGNTCYFEPPTGQPALAAAAERAVSPVQQEGAKTLHAVLAWLDFLVAEIRRPLNELDELLETAEAPGNSPGADLLAKAREKATRLKEMADAIASLNWAEGLVTGASFEEVDVSQVLEWVARQVSEMAAGFSVEISATPNERIRRFPADRRSLTQAMLYVARAAVARSPRGSSLLLGAAEIEDDIVLVTFTNPGQYLAPQAHADMLQGRLSGLGSGQGGELYAARLLMQGIGGKLDITSGRARGTVYTLTIPGRWQSQLREVNALRLAAEISRREAGAVLRKLQDDLAVTGEVKESVKENLEKLRGKIQELGVLANRSLFVTDDLGTRLEVQQEELFRREDEHLAVTEALLAICRETALALGAAAIFKPGSAGRVARYSLAIASELRLSGIGRQALHRAALLKDLGLALSPREMVERKVTSTLEGAIAIRMHFERVWRGLAGMAFMAPALELIRRRYERWDGSGGPAGGEGVPLGARILAVADAFDEALAAGDVDSASVMVAAGAGRRFDPEVAGALLRVLKDGRLEATSPQAE